MIYDYYDIEAYDQESYDFFMTVENYGSKHPFGDIYLSYLELPEDIKARLPKRYEIDPDAYLFYLIRFYALKNPLQRKRFLRHPYIESLTVNGEINHIHTVFGDADFKFWVKGLLDILQRSIKNRDNEPISKTFKLLFAEYTGAYDGRCHEASIQFSGSNKVVTAFVSEPQSELRFLHSFLENDERVLETTSNIVMSKEDYYQLSKPEILTIIPYEELYEFYETFYNRHPRLEALGTRQLLAEFEEIKRHPDTIKIKEIIR